MTFPTSLVISKELEIKNKYLRVSRTVGGGLDACIVARLQEGWQGA